MRFFGLPKSSHINLINSDWELRHIAECDRMFRDRRGRIVCTHWKNIIVLRRAIESECRPAGWSIRHAVCDDEKGKRMDREGEEGRGRIWRTTEWDGSDRRRWSFRLPSQTCSGQRSKVSGHRSPARRRFISTLIRKYRVADVTGRNYAHDVISALVARRNWRSC